MADEKTEKPTPKKLEEAKKKGQVLKSQDLTQSAMFLTAGTVMYAAGPMLVDGLKGFMRESFSAKVMEGNFTAEALTARFGDAFFRFLLLSAPLLGALVVAALAANAAQLRGINFAPEVFTPKFEKFNPAAGLQRLFLEMRPYLELVKSLVKFAVVLGLAYTTLYGHLRDLILVSRVDIKHTAQLAPTLLFEILFKVGGAFIVLGAADFGLQFFLYKKQLMMSKEEVKQEHKNSEGDPHVKAHRKALHAAMLRESALKQVPKAQAVLVNPTHIAVALRYDGGQAGAPRVVAKGEMELAEKIREIAREHKVPILRNVPLARSLNTLELEEEIPEELYVSVAEVLNLVARLADGE